GTQPFHDVGHHVSVPWGKVWQRAPVVRLFKPSAKASGAIRRRYFRSVAAGSGCTCESSSQSRRYFRVDSHCEPTSPSASDLRCNEPASVNGGLGRHALCPFCPLA
ncbi:hypothetical protein PUNSTDRAFT_143525, partial [Punctularia strigosozonata HHB-11173 SS5]|uniref:uncharacterized protein n=1 Tax=Punctularia strigosozonata (strain HHB-11173) TaxID=741275 RepID=UPI0004417403